MGIAMKDLTNELKSFIVQLGAVSMGVTPVDRFEQAPAGHHPTKYLPGVKSVMTFAYNLGKGAVNNLPVSRNQYTQEFDAANAVLGQMAHKAARFLENKGYESIAFGPEASVGDYSRLKGDFSHKHSAVLCGLGIFGINNLVITPEHRSRVRFASILTTAQLEYDEIAELNDCEKCLKCVKICPSGALDHWKGKYSPQTGWVINKEKCAHYIFVVNQGKRCGMCVKACTGK